MNVSVPFEAFPWNSDSNLIWSIIEDDEKVNVEDSQVFENGHFQSLTRRLGKSNFETTLGNKTQYRLCMYCN